MTIAEICQLSDEVRTGELLISVFIDRAIKDPASKEADRGFVLRATYPTAPLRSLAEHVAQKLSGRHPKGSAVIRGTHGSGKSHGLLALYHVVAAGEEAWSVLETWGVQAMPPATARVALLCFFQKPRGPAGTLLVGQRKCQRPLYSPRWALPGGGLRADLEHLSRSLSHLHQIEDVNRPVR